MVKLIPPCRSLLIFALLLSAGLATFVLGGADSDGDGIPDAEDNCPAVANPDQANGDVTVFGPQKIIGASGDNDGAFQVHAADLDGDGDADVLSTSGVDLTIAWYENLDGRGTFGAKRVITADAYFAVVVAADIDGDGDQDVVAAMIGDNFIRWFENVDGAGTFGANHVIVTGDFPVSIFAADLDGDEDLDLAAVIDRGIAWFENTDGLGTFGPARNVTTLLNEPRSVFAADLDGDGDRDLLSASVNDDTIAWFENLDGAGDFGPPRTISDTANGATVAISADLDGDGDLDAISGSIYDDRIKWYENEDGTGNFSAPRQIGSASEPFSLFATDLDGDGDVDVLAADRRDDRVVWFENTDGTGVFGYYNVISSETDDATSVFAADLDNDGAPEVLSASGKDDKIAWYDASDPQGDACDNCPYVANTGQYESDGDGRGDDCDNCPAHPNANQVDIDGDRVGDVCDNCPNLSNLAQLDADGDGVGDDCDACTDVDSDGYGGPGFPANTCPLDNCPDVANASQRDTDFDALGDPCDACPLDPSNDADADGFCGDVDNCPPYSNPSQSDGDGDGIGDRCDNCSGVVNPEQADFDSTPTFERVGFTGQALGASSAEAADLNGDGLLDVLAASADDDTIAWYPNLGRGIFGPRRPISTLAEGASSVFAADVDGDGDQDVLSASAGDGKIAWYKNIDSAGGFGPPIVISAVSPGASDVAAADLDGDGDIDALSASSEDDTIAWYENLDGAGGFGPPRVITSNAVGATAVFVADLDGDGSLDVLSASGGDDTVAWHRNLDGAGSFGERRTISAVVSGASSVFAADLDSDGDLDVLSAAATSATIAWYENTDGRGGFGPERLITNLATNTLSVVAADVDRDGDIDVFSSAADPVIQQPTALWYENLDGDGNFAFHVVSRYHRGDSSIRAVDLDSDGDTDLLTASFTSGRLSWYENNGDGVGDVCDNCPDTPNFRQLDLDNDGVGDECDACTDGDGDGFGDPDYPASFCTEDNCPETANPGQEDLDLDGLGDACDLCPDDVYNDMDGDGLCRDIDNCQRISNADQADGDGDGVGDACDNCEVQFNPDQEDFDTSGSFGPVRRISWNAYGPVKAITVDIDGDGDPDVVTGSALDDRVAWYENVDGEGEFGPQRVISREADFLTDIAAADLDGDGDNDVLSSSWFDTTVAWYENTDGRGDFGPPKLIGSFGQHAGVSTADLDGDGDMDCLASGWDAGGVYWFENTDGLGHFGPLQSIGSGIVANGALAADLDGDGDQDVVSTLGDNAGIVWYENADGSGTFAPQRVIVTEGSSSVVAADMDDDGDVDLVAGLKESNQVVWLENVDGVGNFGARFISTATGQAPVDAKDLDGDGDFDVVSTSLVDTDIAWYENLGGALAFGPPSIISDDTVDARSVVAADLDGDGRPDLLTVSFINRVAWHKNGPDGVGNICDNCPATDNLDQDNSDADELGDACDNCPSDTNPGQLDTDLDTAGDACDNCETDPNPDQADLDLDGDGDVCDACTDTDGDGFGNPGLPSPLCEDDNCPNEPNPAQAESDGDGVGDVCDNCPFTSNPEQLNPDGDLFGNACDNCPMLYNPNQADRELDGVGDVCDNCREVPNAGQENSDSDSFGDACDNCPATSTTNMSDQDEDTVGDVCDNCPAHANPDQADADDDGPGDACDECTDSDGDGFGDPGFAANLCDDDNCPDVGNPLQLEADGDGVGDACDNCGQTPNPLQRNADGDRLGNACDNCVLVTNPSQTDSDADDEGDACDLDDGMIFVLLDADVSWQMEADHEAWNVYRGDLADLLTQGLYTQPAGSNDLADQTCGLSQVFLGDPIQPQPAQVAFYLVTGITAGVESDLGAASSGSPRPNDNPCP